MIYKPGARVIAISHADDNALYIFGYGTYEGNFIPPYISIEEEVATYRAEYEKARIEDPNLPEAFDEVQFKATLEQVLGNPRIKLDNGKTVWGYECWWSETDEGILEELKGKVIVELDIEAERRKLVN